MASTLNITNSNFLSGNYIFNRIGNPSSVVNQGTIIAQNGGTINLFGGAVSNTGTINAPGGQVNLAVGEQISFLNPSGIGFQVVVDQPLLDKVNGVQTAILNSGSIKSDLVKLQTNLTDGLYQLAVNNTGLVQATAAVSNNGAIQFVARQGVLNAGGLSNSGGIKATNAIDLQAGTFLNSGQVVSGGDLNMNLTETTTLTRQDPDGTLIHSPDGSSTFNLYARPLQTISFSLYNQPGGSIEAARTLTITSKNLYNTSASIQAGLDLKIKADLLLNERAGFWTEGFDWRTGIDGPSPYLPGAFERSDESSRYAYWIDRLGSLPEASLGAGRDIVLTVENTINANSLIEAGRDLRVDGGSFANTIKVLQGTQGRRWRGAGFLGGRNKQFFEGPLSIGGSHSSILVGNNASFKLSGDFKNSSLILADGLGVEAQNARIGILDNRTLTPPPTVLPARLFVGFWAEVPADITGLDSLDATSRNALALAIRSQLFNLTGKSFIGGEWMSADNSLAQLIKNAKDAIAANISLHWGTALSQEQIDALDKPMLWMEEDEDGKRRLVVYVPERFRSGSNPEGLIQANNIDFEIKDRFYNSGTVVANNGLVVDANEILNEARTVNRSAVVRENKGLFGGSRKTVYYNVIQSGGNLIGNNILLNADKSITNRGGSVFANGNLLLFAPEINNEAQVGSHLLTWKSSFADKLIGGNKPYSLKPVFQSGSLSGNTVATFGSDFRNIGSIVYGQDNVSINATSSVTNSWITGTYTAKDSYSFGKGALRRDTETGHVIQSSTIASDGDVTVKTGQFTNIASDVIGKNVNVEADNINISDGVLQSTDKHSKLGFSKNGTHTAGFNYQQKTDTKTTERQSNIIATENLALKAEKNILIKGSKLTADNKLSAEAEQIDIKAGEYTNKQTRTGGGLNAGWTGGLGVGINAGGYKGSSNQKVLTPSEVSAKQVELKASQGTIITASEVNGSESVKIKAPKVTIQGQEAPFNSKTTSGSVGVNADVINGGFAVTASLQNGETKGGNYVISKIYSLSLEIDSPDQKIDGANINGQNINPHKESWSTTTNYGGGIAINPFTGQVSVSANFNDYSVFGGLGQSGGFVGGGYNNLIVGSNLTPGSGSTGIGQGLFAGYAGIGTVGLNHTTTEGTSSHDVWTPNFNLLGVTGGASFQEGNYIGSAVNFGNHVLSSDINQPFQYTCFPAGTKITEKQDFNKPIETIKVNDIVLSRNLETRKLEWKRVTDTYVRQAQKLIQLTLADGTLLKPTPDHPVYVKGSWIKASDLKVGDAVLNSDLKEVSIKSIEEIPGTTVFNFTVEDNHNYFAESILVHNADKAAYEAQGIVTLKGSVERTLSVVDSTPNNTDLINQSLNDLQKIIKGNANLTAAQQASFQSRVSNVKSLVSIGGWSSSTQSNFNEIVQDLDKTLQAHAIETGNFTDYSSKEQKQETTKYIVDLLQSDLINAPASDQPELIKELNYWQKIGLDLQEDKIKQINDEQTRQAFMALDFIMMAAAPEEKITEKIITGPVQKYLIENSPKLYKLIENNFVVKKIVNSIIKNADEAVPKASKVFDYSVDFENDLVKFLPNAKLKNGVLDDDLFLVSYHVDKPVGQGRSVKWWTTFEQGNKMSTIEDIHQSLALLPEWGSREAVSVAKIPQGTKIESYQGFAEKQFDPFGNEYKGGGEQFRFKFFDEAWIIDTRSISQ
jgi:hypothetical protein